MAAPISQSFHDDSYCPGTVVANICRDSQKVRFKFDRYSCGLLSQAGNLRPAIEIVPFPRRVKSQPRRRTGTISIEWMWAWGSFGTPFKSATWRKTIRRQIQNSEQMVPDWQLYRTPLTCRTLWETRGRCSTWWSPAWSPSCSSSSSSPSSSPSSPAWWTCSSRGSRWSWTLVPGEAITAAIPSHKGWPRLHFCLSHHPSPPHCPPPDHIGQLYENQPGLLPTHRNHLTIEQVCQSQATTKRSHQNESQSSRQICFPPQPLQLSIGLEVTIQRFFCDKNTRRPFFHRRSCEMDAFNQSCETMKKNIAKILSHSFNQQQY